MSAWIEFGIGLHELGFRLHESGFSVHELGYMSQVGNQNRVGLRIIFIIWRFALEGI